MSLGDIEMNSPSKDCCYSSLQKNDRVEEEITSLNYCQCCKTCLQLLLLFGWVSYYILAIISLSTTTYQQEREICPLSDLWLYLLLSLIGNVSLITISTQRSHPNIYSQLKTNIVIIIFKTLFIIWWSLEIQYSGCLHKLEDTHLYYISMTQSGLDIVIVTYLSGLSIYLSQNQRHQKRRFQQQAVREVTESFEDFNEEEKELIIPVDI